MGTVRPEPEATPPARGMLEAVALGRAEHGRNPSHDHPNRFVWYVDGRRVPGPLSALLTKFCQQVRGGPYVAVPPTGVGRAFLTPRGRALLARWSR